jgi:hypothetical protein
LASGRLDDLGYPERPEDSGVEYAAGRLYAYPTIVGKGAHVQADRGGRAVQVRPVHGHMPPVAVRVGVDLGYRAKAASWVGHKSSSVINTAKYSVSVDRVRA